MSLAFNPFDLLDENGGDRPRKQPPKPKPAADAPKTQPAPQAKAAPAKNAPAAGAAQVGGKKDNDAKAKPQGDAQKPKGAGKEGAGKKPPGQQQQQQQQQQAIAPAGVPREGGAYASENAAEKPRERRDRDPRTHDRTINPRGRQYDRRSGTGRPAFANEAKRGGSGKGNWGTIEEGQEAEVPKGEGEGEKEENVAPVEGGGDVAPAEPPKEPEKEYFTMDEYLAKKKPKVLVGVEAPKLRAAGEGVDTSAWADYAPLEKSENEDAPAKKKKDAKKVATNGGKVSVDKFFRVTMPAHEGSDSRRGGRGGKTGPGFSKPGGGGGRGRPQVPGGGGGGAQQRPGDRKKSGDTNVSLADQTQFPSLGGEAPTSPVQSAPAPVKA